MMQVAQAAFAGNTFFAAHLGLNAAATELQALGSGVSGRFEETGNRFLAILSGTTDAPPPEQLYEEAKEWTAGLRQLSDALIGNGALRRAIFWRAIDILTHLIPQGNKKLGEGRYEKCLEGYGDGEYVKMLTVYRALATNHILGNMDDLFNGYYPYTLNMMMERGLLSDDGAPDGVPLPKDEMFVSGSSPYARELLEPAFQLGIQHYEGTLERGMREKFNATLPALARCLMLYQARRARSPSLPEDILISSAIMVIARRDFNKGVEISYYPQVIYHGLAVMLRIIPHYLASVPDEEFESHRDRIKRDFPEALCFREGRGQLIDKDAVNAALAFPEGGEDLIMHLCVGDDIEQVKTSLKNLRPGGRVVAVDTSRRAINKFRQDLATSAAINNGTLLLETEDYRGRGLRSKYAGKATRAYLLHPVDIESVSAVLRDLMVPGGLAVIQASDRPNCDNYLSFNSPMFGWKGSFEMVAGYRNGPAWFRTESAVKDYRDCGIMLSVARRKS